jgi:hypothetical protein
MRHTFGAFWTCLAVMGASACSDASPPAAEGDLTASLSGGLSKQGAIAGDGDNASPTGNSYGRTVLNGTNGVQVTCKVSPSGTTYVVEAHIQSADMSVDLASGDILKGAQMTFLLPGSVETFTSVDSENNRAANCSVNLAAPFIVKSRSIYANFHCPTVRSTSNLAAVASADGYFVFTGCDK